MTSYQLFANMLWLKFVHPSVSAYSPMDLMGLCFSDLTPPSADNSLATTADENGGGRGDATADYKTAKRRHRPSSRRRTALIFT